jgi:putative addiction module component (TIGR02574 family)
MASPTIDFSHLTPEQRLQLIGELWDSLSDEDLGPISPELAAELDRRVAEMEANPTAGRPWEEVLAELRERLK